MKIKSITFQELWSANQSKQPGIVIMGAGGKLEDWISGFTNLWKKEGFFAGEIEPIQSAATISGNIKGSKGRKDLVIFFNSKCKLDIGKLAMWRLRVGGVSWIEDFVVNYRNDYK